MPSTKATSRLGLAWLLALASCMCPRMSNAGTQASGTPGEPPIRELAANVPASYVLGPDDQMVIHVVDVPEITATPQKLDRDGDLRLPMVGRVHAAGMTIAQLESELSKRLKEYLQNPDVSIMVTDSRSQVVSIIGAVPSSGAKRIVEGQTLVEVLSLAGGLTADAGPTVRVARRIEDGRIPLADATDDPSGAFSVVELDARALLDGKTPDRNIPIQARDTISVPRADVIYVIGEVGKPGPVPLSGGHPISVMEAVSASGGTLRTAANSRARILRLVAGQDMRAELNVNLQRIMNGKASDVAMAPWDILVVPDSTGKRATSRAIEAAIQVGTMIGTYGVIR
jgi:polysaccharide export outer membrane protein